MKADATSKMLATQRNEMTEHVIYKRFSERTKDAHNREILLRLSEHELQHHNRWKQHTGREVKPHALKVWLYCVVSMILGMTFGLKLLENNLRKSKAAARQSMASQLAAEPLTSNEDDEERELLGLINEERLNYTSAMVLGLNDALVELTGALAGFTFAMQSPRIVAMAGLISGIAAALSMGGTSYLAKKSEESVHTPLKFALYTGVSYIVTVFLLILPYLIFDNVYISLGVMFLEAIVVITIFNFYISVAKDVSFREKFSEMALMSFGIAAISFGIGFLVREFLGVEL